MVRPRKRHHVELQAAQRQQLQQADAAASTDPYPSDAVQDHGVKRARWSPQVQDTREFGPNDSMETAEVRLQGVVTTI